MPINTFREHLTCFPNVESFIFFFPLELVYKVGGFVVNKGGDGISEAGVGAGERLGRDVDGTRLAAGMVAGEGTTGSGGGTRAEVGRFAEVGGGRCLQEIESGAVCGEDVEIFTEDPFEFRKARIVGGDEGAEWT